jgi:hypothetical protein
MSKEKLFTDEKEHKDGSFLTRMKSCPSLKQGDFVVMYENNEKEIDWNDINDLKERLFKVTGLSSEEGYGLISFIKHNTSSQNATYGKSAFELKSKQKSFSNRHTQFNGVKAQIDRLGNISLASPKHYHSDLNNSENVFNEPQHLYQKNKITYFSSFEEMNEADARNNAAISPETHLHNASERAKKIFPYDLQKLMDKKIKFKDGHSD